MWRHMLTIPGVRRLKQGDREFETRLGYIVKCI